MGNNITGGVLDCQELDGHGPKAMITEIRTECQRMYKMSAGFRRIHHRNGWL